MYIEDAKKDFEYLNELPGTKLLLKGNHDYWWESIKKMREFLKNNNYKNIDLIVKDNNGSTATETIKFKFINKIYFGSAAEPATYDDVFVKGLSGFSIDSITDYKAAMTVADTQYGYIALDTAVADDEFLVNSMDVTLKNCGTVVINTTVYNVYRTNQSGLGKIIIQSL